MARAIFEPQEEVKNGPETDESIKPASHRGSVSSSYSSESKEALEIEQPVLRSPLWTEELCSRAVDSTVLGGARATGSSLQETVACSD